MESLLEKLIEYAGSDYESSQAPFLTSLIENALEEVLLELYPYGFNNDSQKEKVKAIALKRYKSKILMISEYHYDKQGKEGVTSYSENGTSASYEKSGTPSSYLRGIIPIAKIV